MRQLDRYVLGQLLGPFGFFALIFAMVIWLTQSLRVVDTVVNNNQSGMVFLELSALLLPTVIAIVIPIAAFAGTLLTVNRLYSESELVVMMAAGQSGPSLARPVLLFGVVAMVAMAMLSLYLMPLSANQLRERTAEIRAELASSILREGQFSNPIAGLTIYIRNVASTGDMVGIFVHDARKPEEPITYTADRARLIRDGDRLQLGMYSGTAQRFEANETNLSVLDFDQLVYDLGPIQQTSTRRNLKPEEYFFPTLINPPEEIWSGSAKRYGQLIAEGHDQLSAPLYALTLPLVALAVFLSQGFQRGGFAVRIGLALAVGIGFRLLGVVLKAQVVRMPEIWPVLYMPPLLMFLGSLMLLGIGPNPIQR